MRVILLMAVKVAHCRAVLVGCTALVVLKRDSTMAVLEISRLHYVLYPTTTV